MIKARFLLLWRFSKATLPPFGVIKGYKSEQIFKLFTSSRKKTEN